MTKINCNMKDCRNNYLDTCTKSDITFSKVYINQDLFECSEFLDYKDIKDRLEAIKKKHQTYINEIKEDLISLALISESEFVYFNFEDAAKCFGDYDKFYSEIQKFLEISE